MHAVMGVMQNVCRLHQLIKVHFPASVVGTVGRLHPKTIKKQDFNKRKQGETNQFELDHIQHFLTQIELL